MFDSRFIIALRRASGLLTRQESDNTDAAFLDQYARDRDPAAFAGLLDRHGPAIWSLCRRLVRSEADAEDLFQATFLVLARDASRVRKATSIASWLYGVTSRISRKVRLKNERVLDLERLRNPSTQPDPVADLSWNEVRAALDEELALLSDSLRAPILLCYFDGLTQDAAAARLGWSQRQVKHRVARARELLRTRLTRRGIELPAALAVPLLYGGVAVAVPSRIVDGLLASVAARSAGRALETGLSPAVISLAKSESHMISFFQLAALIVSAGLIFTGTFFGWSMAANAPAEVVQNHHEVPRSLSTVRIGTPQFRQQSGWHVKVFFSSDARTLISMGEGDTIRFFDTKSGREIDSLTIPGADSRDSDFAPGSNLLALFGYDKTDSSKPNPAIWLVDTADCKTVRAIAPRDIQGTGSFKIRITRDGKHLIVGTDREVRVWDTKSGNEVGRLNESAGNRSLAVSNDGKTISFGSNGQFLWKWESDERSRQFIRLGGLGIASAFSPDDKTLYFTINGGVVGYDVVSGRKVADFHVGLDLPKWSISPNGKILAIPQTTADRPTQPLVDNAILLLDVSTGREIRQFPFGRVDPSWISWSPDGSKLAIASDYRIWAWDVETSEAIGTSPSGHDAPITAFAFGSDGQLFTASKDGTIRSWDSSNGKPTLTFTYEYWVRDVALSPDGSLLAGSTLGNDLRIRDAKTGSEKFRLLDNDGSRMVRFSRDGKYLVAWGQDEFLRIWDTRNGKLLAENSTAKVVKVDPWNDSQVNQMVTTRFTRLDDLSEDGSTLALNNFKTLKVFDTRTGKEVANLESDPNGAAAMALSPDGKRVAIVGRGKRIQTRLPNGKIQNSTAREHQYAVWDLSSQKPIWEQQSSTLAYRLAFSPDGKTIAQLLDGEDKKYAVQLLDASTGKELSRIDIPQRGLELAFDRTGKRLAVAFPDTTASIFEVLAARN